MEQQAELKEQADLEDKEQRAKALATLNDGRIELEMRRRKAELLQLVLICTEPPSPVSLNADEMMMLGELGVCVDDFDKDTLTLSNMLEGLADDLAVEDGEFVVAFSEGAQPNGATSRKRRKKKRTTMRKFTRLPPQISVTPN